jgi:hypothetical protein
VIYFATAKFYPDLHNQLAEIFAALMPAMMSALLVRRVATTLVVAVAAAVFFISCDHAREMKGGLTGSTCFHLSALFHSLSPLAFPSPPLCLYPLACIDLVIGPVLVAAAGESGSISIKI